TESVPDPGPVDDAAGPNLADDHDPLACGDDPHGAIPGGRPRAFADDIGGAIWMAHRQPGSLWRKHDGTCHRDADEVDVAACLGRALPVPQIVRPVVLFDDCFAGGVHGHDVGDVAAPPRTILPAMPRITAPPIQLFGCSTIGIIVDPGGAHG